MDELTKTLDQVVSFQDTIQTTTPVKEMPKNIKFKPNSNMKSDLRKTLIARKRMEKITNDLQRMGISHRTIANVRFEMMNDTLNDRTLTDLKDDLDNLMLKWGLDMITIRHFGNNSYMINVGDGNTVI